MGIRRINVISRNARSFMQEIQKLRVQTLPRVEVDNTAPQAEWLRKRGFTVTDMETLDRFAEQEMRALLLRPGAITTNRMNQALRRAGFKAVRFFQSFTSELRPPARAGGPERPAHPGLSGGKGFADVTTETASSYTVRSGNGPAERVDYSGRSYR